MTSPVRLSRRQLLAAPTAALLAPTLAFPVRLFARQTPASPGATGPQLHVSATAVQFDEAFEIGVTGLNPGDQVTIRSDFLDARNQTWSAEATYAANEVWRDRLFEPGSDLGGFYGTRLNGVHMGGKPRIANRYYPTLFGPEPVTITATIGGSPIGSTIIQRTILPGPDTSESINTPELVAHFYPPVSQHARSRPSRDRARRLRRWHSYPRHQPRCWLRMATRHWPWGISRCRAFPQHWSTSRWSISATRSPGCRSGKRLIPVVSGYWATPEAANSPCFWGPPIPKSPPW